MNTRRILAAIAALVMALAVLAVAPTSTAAQAGPALRLSCNPTVSALTSYRVLNFYPDTGSGQRPQARRTEPRHVAFTTYVNFRSCGPDTRYVISARFDVETQNFQGCLSGAVQNFKMNMNQIGNWNPGEITFDCQSQHDQYSVLRDNPASNQYVFRSDPANEKCFSTRNQISLMGQLDVSGYGNTSCFFG